MKDGKIGYQIIIITDPKLKEREELSAKITDFVSKEGLKVAKADDLGTKDMAYEIKGLTRGNYQVFRAEAESPVSLNKINIFLNREPNVIRYLVLKK